MNRFLSGGGLPPRFYRGSTSADETERRESNSTCLKLGPQTSQSYRINRVYLTCSMIRLKPFALHDHFSEEGVLAQEALRGLIFSTLRATGDSLFLCRCQTSDNLGNSQPAYEGQTGHRSWTRKSQTKASLRPQLYSCPSTLLYGSWVHRPEITDINESNLLLMAWLEHLLFQSAEQKAYGLDSVYQ